MLNKNYNLMEYMVLAVVIFIMSCMNSEIIDDKIGNISIIFIIMMYAIFENLNINSFWKCRKKLDE